MPVPTGPARDLIGRAPCPTVRAHGPIVRVHGLIGRLHDPTDRSAVRTPGLLGLRTGQIVLSNAQRQAVQAIPSARKRDRSNGRSKVHGHSNGPSKVHDRSNDPSKMRDRSNGRSRVQDRNSSARGPSKARGLSDSVLASK